MANGELKQAIELAKSGQKREAWILLEKIVKTEPGNETAWLWLASCVETNDQKISCLRNALAINPNNPKAQQALDHLVQVQNQPSFQELVAPPQSTMVPQSAGVATPNPQAANTKKRRPFIFLWIVCIAALIVACILAQVFRPSGSSPAASIPNPSQPTLTPKPTTPPPMTVKTGELSSFKDTITREGILNVQKKDGTLDQRQDDLKELSLDWVFYREKIQEYQSAGNTKKAAEAQASMQEINAWLSAYNENDVQTMLAWVEKNGWRR